MVECQKKEENYLPLICLVFSRFKPNYILKPVKHKRIWNSEVPEPVILYLLVFSGMKGRTKRISLPNPHNASHQSISSGCFFLLLFIPSCLCLTLFCTIHFRTEGSSLILVKLSSLRFQNRIPEEPLGAKPSKEAEMQKILRSTTCLKPCMHVIICWFGSIICFPLLQGIPGAPGIKTYSTEVFGDEEADDEDGCEKFKDSHSIFTKLEFIQQNDHMGGTWTRLKKKKKKAEVMQGYCLHGFEGNK